MAGVPSWVVVSICLLRWIHSRTHLFISVNVHFLVVTCRDQIDILGHEGDLY